MHDGGIFCRQELAFSASQCSETQLGNAEIVHRDLLPEGSVKHDAVSKSPQRRYASLPHNSCYTVSIIIIDMAIPLTRANRLAAMRESDERITSTSISHPS